MLIHALQRGAFHRLRESWRHRWPWLSAGNSDRAPPLPGNTSGGVSDHPGVASGDVDGRTAPPATRTEDLRPGDRSGDVGDGASKPVASIPRVLPQRSETEYIKPKGRQQRRKLGQGTGGTVELRSLLSTGEFIAVKFPNKGQDLWREAQVTGFFTKIHTRTCWHRCFALGAMQFLRVWRSRCR